MLEESKSFYYIYYIRFLLTPVGAFFSMISCLGTLTAHFFYPDMRKSICKIRFYKMLDNVIAFMIIACHFCVGIYLFAQSFNNFGYW